MTPAAAFSSFCPGKAEAQSGTVPFFKNGVCRQVTRGTKHIGSWRKTMTQVFKLHARQQQIREPLQGALQSSIVFIVPRLAKHPKTKDGERWPFTYRDADKLERAVNDSLTKAGVICDDNRICVTTRIKRYATLHETPGVLVKVWQMSSETTPEMINGD